jgi:hypothetical protein
MMNSFDIQLSEPQVLQEQISASIVGTDFYQYLFENPTPHFFLTNN